MAPKWNCPKIASPKQACNRVANTNSGCARPLGWCFQTSLFWQMGLIAMDKQSCFRIRKTDSKPEQMDTCYPGGQPPQERRTMSEKKSPPPLRLVGQAEGQKPTPIKTYYKETENIPNENPNSDGTEVKMDQQETAGFFYPLAQMMMMMMMTRIRRTMTTTPFETFISEQWVP